MVILNPEVVRFGERTWRSVSSVVVERTAKKVVAEVGDAGPHVVFADVTEQRCTITVTQDLEQSDLDAPGLGELGALQVYTGASASDRGRAALAASAVVIEVKSSVVRGQPSSRRITLLAVSSDGATDPLSTGVSEEPV